MQGKSCCVPSSDADTPASQSVSHEKRCSEQVFDLCDIPGGRALVGTNRKLIPLDEEGPCRSVEIKPFRIMQTAVTNSLFTKFVEETGYRTEAERIGWSFVFYHQLPENFRDTEATVGTEWWRKVEGACWNKIAGPEAPPALHDDHPVVHVSWNDARAFSEWAGGRLPTEAEWEHAARGGLGDVLFPWGDTEPDDTQNQPCNIWQGTFPTENTCADGYAATAPAKSYKPNDYGLYNMSGNVWEWTSGRMKIVGRSEESKIHAKHFKGTKLLKGGSFLCHKSYCFRYRIAARTGNTPDSASTHQGFRVVFDPENAT